MIAALIQAVGALMAAEKIPTPGQLALLKKLLAAASGASPVINREDAEDCDTNGWVEAQPGTSNQYRLTPAGRQILKQHG